MAVRFHYGRRARELNGPPDQCGIGHAENLISRRHGNPLARGRTLSEIVFSRRCGFSQRFAALRAPDGSNSIGPNWKFQKLQHIAPVAQRIEHWPPKPCAQVRLLSGALSENIESKALTIGHECSGPSYVTPSLPSRHLSQYRTCDRCWKSFAILAQQLNGEIQRFAHQSG
jgi:hypothetical protein